MHIGKLNWFDRMILNYRKVSAGSIRINIFRKEMFSMPVIDVKATGANIKAIMKMKGFKIADFQVAAWRRCANYR